MAGGLRMRRRENRRLDLMKKKRLTIRSGDLCSNQMNDTGGTQRRVVSIETVIKMTRGTSSTRM